MSSILQIAHHSRIGGQFKFSHPMSRLGSFHYRQKARDVKKYADGCMKCQKFKVSNAKNLKSAETMEMPERRWASLSTDFIICLPITKSGLDSVTTWIDRLSKRVQFVKSKRTETVLDVADPLFDDTFNYYGRPTQ